jgi:hypothetical protein
MRLYFHLVNSSKRIPDEQGVEVSDIAQVHMEALLAIEEVRQEGEICDHDWSGWALNVTDATGTVVLALDLERSDELVR